MAEAFEELKKKMRGRRYGQPPTEATENMEPDPAAEEPVPQRIDGRTLRRTGRTIGFSTRVSPEFEFRIKRYAAQHNMMIVEVLERALDALEREEAASKERD